MHLFFAMGWLLRSSPLFLKTVCWLLGRNLFERLKHPVRDLQNFFPQTHCSLSLDADIRYLWQKVE